MADPGVMADANGPRAAPVEDRGFIGFEDNGKLLISPVAHRQSLERMGIDTTKVVNVGGFTSGQKHFLDFHRNAVLLQSVRA